VRGGHNDGVPTDEKFTKVLRGYDMAQVDALRTQVEQAVASSSWDRKAAVREAVRRASFPIVFRGYDRPQVDYYFEQALAELQ
jgi:DivIVA domain-containing protein